jgi:hypothetical protein
MPQRVYLRGVVEFAEDDPEKIFRLKITEATREKLLGMPLYNANPIVKRGNRYWLKILATERAPLRRIRPLEGILVRVTATIRRYRFRAAGSLIEGWSLSAYEVNI